MYILQGNAHMNMHSIFSKLSATFKEAQPSVIFTTSADKLFSEYSPTEIPFKDAKLSIFFETQEMMDESLVLLRFNCPDTSCEYVATGWNDLKLHARGVHGKQMWYVIKLLTSNNYFLHTKTSDLCLRHKKVFSHEHALYSSNVLSMHLPSIPHRQQKSLPVDQIEGGVHPMCEFDRECFFGDDEIYSHMRERHEECFICKRNDIRNL
jgi:E3 ubiquitin-protein ligase ZNF598